MELEAFVSSTLIQIARGVHAAQAAVRELGGFVNPAVQYAKVPEGYVGHAEGLPTYRVDFDVAVTAGTQKGTDAGIGVRVASIIDAKAGGKSSKAEETVSRIRFTVPVALPIDETSLQNKRQADEKRKAQQDAVIEQRRNRGGLGRL